MFATLRKTAMSPIIYEVLDVGTGVTDDAGNLADSGAGIPTFVGVIDKAVRRIIELARDEPIVEGDMFVTNDPNFGGVTHLNDVVIAMPVFRAGERLAWAASIGHWSDVGGMTPGSMSTDAVEIHQEGIRLPAVKLFEAGRRVEAIFDIIKTNSRVPEVALGDLWAQVSASRRAGRGLERLAEDFGVDAFREAVADMFEEGELRARRGLAGLPAGTYRIAEEQDDGAVWKAEIRISQEEFEVDLRDNPQQRASPYNTSRDGAVISAQMIFKALTDSGRFANAGSFRPLKVLTRPGSVFHAGGNAPHGYYFETRIRLYGHALALHGEGLSGPAAGGKFRLDLRHGAGRGASRYRQDIRHGGAADGRMGSDAAAGRGRLHVFGESRRDIQLPGRDLRGEVRAGGSVGGSWAIPADRGCIEAAGACRLHTGCGGRSCWPPATVATARESGV